MAFKQKRDPDATRAALLKAAEHEFLKNGYGNTSLSKIANCAGMTKSLIHHYFGSKEKLWTEVKTLRFMQYADRQMTMIEEAEPSSELLRASMAFYFNFLKRNPEIVRILAWMFVEQDQRECLDIDRELITAGVEKIRQAQEKGQLRADVDPRFFLFTFIGLCQHWFQDKNHFIASFGTDGLPEDLDDAYMGAIIKIFFEGILPR